MPPLNSSTIIAILNKPGEPNKTAKELTYPEFKKISARSHTRDKAEEVDVNS